MAQQWQGPRQDAQQRKLNNLYDQLQRAQRQADAADQRPLPGAGTLMKVGVLSAGVAAGIAALDKNWAGTEKLLSGDGALNATQAVSIEAAVITLMVAIVVALAFAAKNGWDKTSTHANSKVKEIQTKIDALELLMPRQQPGQQAAAQGHI